MTRGKRNITKANAAELGRKGGLVSKRKPLNIEWREKLEKINRNGLSDSDEIYLSLMEYAKSGTPLAVPAAKELLNRAYGSSDQKLVLSHDPENLPPPENVIEAPRNEIAAQILELRNAKKLPPKKKRGRPPKK